MVRLKGGGGTTFTKMSEFQFHYGTIKSLCPLWMIEAKSNFNSTMVRLKGLAAGDVGVQILFQFHYGTIKS